MLWRVALEDVWFHADDLHMHSELSSNMDDLRYPIGRFRYDPAVSLGSRRAATTAIAEVPARLREAVAGLTEQQLATRYRPGGWTLRQVVHHVADSHVNAYVRFRLALTEDEPLVRPYNEVAWAELTDARDGAVELSLGLLDHLHARWARLLQSLPDEAGGRTMRHPEHGVIDIDHLVQMYAWHGRHHVAHLTSLRARQDW